MNKNRIITRVILLISLVSFFTDIASEMLYPVMPVYLRSIGFSVMLIGILEGVAEATAGLSKGYFGNLSDQSGKRLPFVRWGYLLSAVSKPMMAVFIYPVWIFFARTLDRLGKGIRTSARDALLSDESKKENKGKVFGFHRALDTAGAAIGPLMALLFLSVYPGRYTLLFIIAFMPGMIAVALTFLIREKKKNKEMMEKARTGFLDYMKYWKKSSSSYKKLTVALLAFALFNSSDAFLLLQLKHHGFSDVSMIGFYIFYNLVYALFAYPAGVLADKTGMKNILTIGFILFVVVYLGMAMGGSFLFFGVLFLLYGVYAASTEGVAKAFITNLSAKDDTATAIGFYHSFASIGSLMASSMAGMIWFLLGPGAMFIITAAMVALIVLYLMMIKIEKVLPHKIYD